VIRAMTRYAAAGAVGALALLLAGGSIAHAQRVTQAPTMSGQFWVGQTITAVGGAWTGPSGTRAEHYVWTRCTDSTPNATVPEERVSELGECDVIRAGREPYIGRQYQLTSADIGRYIRAGIYAWRWNDDNVQDHWMFSAPSVQIAASAPAPAPTPVPTPTPTPTPEPPPPTFDTVAPAATPVPTSGQVLHNSATRRRALRPFPIVRMRGRLTSNGARVTLLSVRAPKRAKVTVRCKGRCPTGRWTRANRKSRLTRVRAFERRLRSGTRITVTVTRHGYIGKRTIFVIRRGRAPVRVDNCLNARGRVTRCP
jgi:hypothetical protein